MMGWNGGVTVANMGGFYTMDPWLHPDYNSLTLFRRVSPLASIARWIQTVTYIARLRLLELI